MKNTDKDIVITGDMILGEVISLKPKTLAVLMSYGLGCIGCPISQMETVEEAAIVHGLEPEFLIKALNE